MLITEENYTAELHNLGYIVGDEMPVAPVISHADYTIDQAFLDVNPTLVGQEGYEIGTVISKPVLGDIPAKVVPPAEEVKAEEVKEPETVQEDIAPVEKQYKYMGKLILSEGSRELNDKHYHTLRLEDGSMVDVTPEDYERNVSEAN